MDNEIVAIYGRKRTGKTRLMLRSLSQKIKDDKDTCILYVDPKGGEYEFGKVVRTYEQIISETNQRPFVLRIPTKNKEALDWICERALEVADRDGEGLIVAVDEAQRFSSCYDNANGFELIQEEGHRGVDLWVTTHRPRDIHANLRAATDRVFIFQTHHSVDIKVFQEHAEVPDEIFKTLKKGDFVEWHFEHGFRIVRVSSKNREENEENT